MSSPKGIASTIIISSIFGRARTTLSLLSGQQHRNWNWKWNSYWKWKWTTVSEQRSIGQQKRPLAAGKSEIADKPEYPQTFVSSINEWPASEPGIYFGSLANLRALGRSRDNSEVIAATSPRSVEHDTRKSHLHCTLLVAPSPILLPGLRIFLHINLAIKMMNA